MNNRGHSLKRRANLSTNSFLLLLMLVSLITASTSIYIANYKFYLEEENLIRMDRQSSIITKIVQINAYYELDKILNDKLVSDEFIKKTSDINGDFIKSIVNQENYKDEHVIFSLAKSKEHDYKLKVNKDYVDIYFNSVYKIENKKRNKDFVLRVTNPYERPDRNRFIIERDIKPLIKILEV